MNLAEKLYEIAGKCDENGNLPNELVKETFELVAQATVESKKNIAKIQEGTLETQNMIDDLTRQQEDLNAFNNLLAMYLTEQGLIEDFMIWANVMVQQNVPPALRLVKN